MRTLTIVIPTHQRSAAVNRLLDGLAEQLSREAAAGVDAIVVDDGSTDGTAEAVVARPFPVPLHVIRQANAGQAAARNRGLAAATGELVWFLDDDMLPSPGLLQRHRRAHADGVDRIMMGPCPPPAESGVLFMVRDWAEELHRELAPTGMVERAVYFSPANTSGPRHVWLAAGGFDHRFVGWGGEDYEIGLRLLQAGVEIRFDPLAVAWHDQRRGLAGFLATKRDEGRNTVRIVRLHPDALDDLIPRPGPSRRLALLRRVAGTSPRRLRLAARAAAAAALAEARLTRGRGRRLFALAVQASFASGVADADDGGALTARLLGR